MLDLTAFRLRLALQTIICQCREDYERLAAFSDNDRNPLGVKLAKLHLSVVEPGAQRERRPISDDAVRTRPCSALGAPCFPSLTPLRQSPLRPPAPAARL